jgi:hypothetical protein
MGALCYLEVLMKLLLEVIFLLGTIIFSLFALLSLDAGGLSDFLGLMVPALICYIIFKYIKSRDV